MCYLHDEFAPSVVLSFGRALDLFPIKVLSRAKTEIFGAAVAASSSPSLRTIEHVFVFCSNTLSICLSKSNATIQMLVTGFVCPIRLTRSSACCASPGVHGRSTRIIVCAAVSVIPTPPAPNVSINTGDRPAWSLVEARAMTRLESSLYRH